MEKDNPVNLLFPEQFLDTISKPIRIKLTLSNGTIQSAKIKSTLFETVTVKKQSLPCQIELPVGTIVIDSNTDIPISGEKSLAIRINPLQKTYEDSI